MAHLDDAALISRTRNTARYFTEKRQIAWVALVGTILWGIIGFFRMPQRKDPDIPVTVAMVVTPWPGMGSRPERTRSGSREWEHRSPSNWPSGAMRSVRSKP